ncbi:hypothetical protein NMK43_08540 [Bacillus licheniformis]|uniref:hypothetical protein n=1 Tax=Bacillus licheniformis TaxID=1402 RepID=UPI0020C840D6|nr:hypothetical protein [Bacillus licheniformis]MCP8973142.1 hypothetical protein [Bacillus licheniformis]
MEKQYEPRPLTELGDLIDRAVLLVCEYGAFEGGLKGISKDDIHIEVDDGQVMAIERSVLESDLTELYLVIE